MHRPSLDTRTCPMVCSFAPSKVVAVLLAILASLLSARLFLRSDDAGYRVAATVDDSRALQDDATNENDGGTNSSTKDDVLSNASATELRSNIDTLLEMIATRPELSTFAAALRITNFANVLCSPQDDDANKNCHHNYTIFAPTDAAFAKFHRPSLLGKLLTPEWSLHLVELLSFHVTTTPFNNDTNVIKTLEMLNDENVTAEVQTSDSASSTIRLANDFTNTSFVNVTDTMLFPSNNRGSDISLHIIDSVLVPSFVEVDLVSIRRRPDRPHQFSILDDILEGFNLGHLLELGDQDLTIFGPTNAAFERLDNETLQSLYNASNFASTLRLMLNHGLATVLPSTQFVSGTSLESEGGEQIYISIDDSKSNGTTVIMANAATITQRDILVNNGIIHAVDQLFLEPYTAATPSNTTRDVLSVSDQNSTLSPSSLMSASNTTSTTTPTRQPSMTGPQSPNGDDNNGNSGSSSSSSGSDQRYLSSITTTMVVTTTVLWAILYLAIP